MGVLTLAGVLVVSQAAFENFCGLLGIDTRPAVDAFSQEERFETNQLTASLALSAVEELDSAISRRPEEYSRRTVQEAVDQGREAINQEDSRPNVVVVMSESFADFRSLTGQVPDEIYAPYDRVAAQGYRGECVVPTFRGYTV